VGQVESHATTGPSILRARNTTLVERTLISRIGFASDLLRSVARVRTSYSSWFRVLSLAYSRGPYPAKLKHRYRGNLTLNSNQEALIFSYPPLQLRPPGTACELRVESVDGAVMRLSLDCGGLSRLITVSGLHRCQDLGVLLGDEYRDLPVSGKTVVDVGASIGDSPIYFALKGARRVIAYEPDPIDFGLLTDNVRANGLDNVIFPKNGFVCAEPSSSSSPGRLRGSVPSRNLEATAAVSVSAVTLQDVLSRERVTSGACLKMDCEGDEYGIIATSSPDTLRCFSSIILEYHYGYRSLAKRLAAIGFRVSVTPPRYFSVRGNQSFPMYVGLLTAWVPS